MNAPSRLKRCRRFWTLAVKALFFVAFLFPAGPGAVLLCRNPEFGLAHAGGTDKSDLDRDGDVDLHDLVQFCESTLASGKGSCADWDAVGQHWNWCEWIVNRDNIERYYDRYTQLFAFIETYYHCQDPPPPPPPCASDLRVTRENQDPLRIARTPDGQRLAVSDVASQSVFVYDVTAGGLVLAGQLKGMSEPLGVALDSQGNLYVGNDGRNRVEVYSPAGCKLRVIGEGKVHMPNDLLFDQQGNLYVVDSEQNRVWVYSPDGSMLRSIGGDRCRFPSSAAIFYRTGGDGQPLGELYIADQGNGLVQVYDLQGNFLRSFGGKITEGSLGWKLKGKFGKLQSLALDQFGRLHALDSYMSQIQIFDPVSGAYVSTYGSYGTNPGQMRLPLDMVILDAAGQVVVASNGNKRMDTIQLP